MQRRLRLKAFLQNVYVQQAIIRGRERVDNYNGNRLSVSIRSFKLIGVVQVTDVKYR